MKNSVTCENMDEFWEHFDKKYKQVIDMYYIIFHIYNILHI